MDDQQVFMDALNKKFIRQRRDRDWGVVPPWQRYPIDTTRGEVSSYRRNYYGGSINPLHRHLICSYKYQKCFPPINIIRSMIRLMEHSAFRYHEWNNVSKENAIIGMQAIYQRSIQDGLTWGPKNNKQTAFALAKIAASYIYGNDVACNLASLFCARLQGKNSCLTWSSKACYD